MLNPSLFSRRFTRRASLLGVLGAAMVLSGCPSNTPAPGGNGPAPSGPSKPLTVAFLGPLTGDAASFGLSQKNGVELAAEEINGSGGVGGQPIKVVYEDTQLDQNKAIAAFNKVVDSDQATVVLGETSSANTMAIGPLADRKGVLLLSPIASAANLTKSGFKMFRVSPSDAFQARIAAQFAHSKGWKKAAIVYTNDEWGGGLNEAFAEEFKKAGGAISVAEGVEPKTQDFRPQLTKIKAAAPQFIYIPLHPDEAGVVLRQAKQQGIAAQFLGADSFSEATTAKVAGPAANGVIFTVPAAGSGEVYTQFAQKYKAKFNEEPNYNAAAAYDALKVIAQAAQTGGADVSALSNSLSQVQGYQGASGSISFDGNGDVTSKAYDLKQVKNGKPETLKAGVSVSG